MKKFLSLVLALSMLFALVACGGGNTPANNTPNDNQNNQQTDDNQPEDTNQPSGEGRPNRLIYGTGTQMAGELGTYSWFNNNATDFIIRSEEHTSELQSPS